MAAVFPESNYKTEGFKPASATKTTLITALTGTWLEITGIRVCASDGVAGTCALFWLDAAGTEYTLNEALAVNPGIPGVEEGLPLHLNPTEILKATPSRANQHVTVTYLSGSRAPKP